MKKPDEYEYFEEKYEVAEYPTKHKSIFKTARSVPFVDTSLHMDVLYKFDRKILGYKTPHEVFFAKIAEWIDDSKLHYKNNCVALDC